MSFLCDLIKNYVLFHMEKRENLKTPETIDLFVQEF